MYMKSGKNKYSKRTVIFSIIFILMLSLFLVACSDVLNLKLKQNNRQFIGDISGSLEEAKRFFSESEGWEIEIKKEDEKSVLSVKTVAGVKYVFIEGYSEDRVSSIEQEVTKKEDGTTFRGIMRISSNEWNFREVIDVYVHSEEWGTVSVKYGIPEYDLINNWGDPGEAELKLLKWVSRDKIRTDWEYAEVVMKKLKMYVDNYSDI